MVSVMNNQKKYKIRQFRNGKRQDGTPFVNYSLTVPSHVGRELPADMEFYCELTDEGILFRPVAHREEAEALPAWASGSGGAGTPAADSEPTFPGQPSPEGPDSPT